MLAGPHPALLACRIALRRRDEIAAVRIGLEGKHAAGAGDLLLLRAICVATLELDLGTLDAVSIPIDHPALEPAMLGAKHEPGILRRAR